MQIPNIAHLNLEHTFDCGQCFRWNKTDGDTYIGVANNRAVEAKLTSDMLVLDGVEDEGLWRNYFDLNSDYGAIKNTLNKDKILKKCIEHGFGIRILKQDPWEALVSFIISANNNIPRIKKIIEALCTMYGEPVGFKGATYYTFPKPQELCGLSVEDLAPIRAGFRDKYILDAAVKVESGEIDLQALYSMSTHNARQEFLKVKGVGKKVADCVLLFAYSKMDVFPQDVWIKNILNNVYNVGNTDIDEFSRLKFGGLSGYAQQYLFYYYREAGMGKNNADKQ